MNRSQRRRTISTAPLPKARADGRPLYYDINHGGRVACFHCQRSGLQSNYGRREAFMADPANSPDGSGDLHTVCLHHLPDNAVIYDPTTNLCRSKDGQNEWMEDSPDEKAKFTR